MGWYQAGTGTARLGTDGAPSVCSCRRSTKSWTGCLQRRSCCAQSGFSQSRCPGHPCLQLVHGQVGWDIDQRQPERAREPICEKHDEVASIAVPSERVQTRSGCDEGPRKANNQHKFAHSEDHQLPASPRTCRQSTHPALEEETRHVRDCNLKENQAEAKWPVEPLEAVKAPTRLPCEVAHARRIGKGLLDLSCRAVGPVVMPRVLELVPQRRHATQVADDVEKRELIAVPSLMHHGTADADQRPTDEQRRPQTDVEEHVPPEMQASLLDEDGQEVDCSESSNVQQTQEQAVQEKVLLAVVTFHVFHKIVKLLPALDLQFRPEGRLKVVLRCAFDLRTVGFTNELSILGQMTLRCDSGRVANVVKNRDVTAAALPPDGGTTRVIRPC